jgi:hypothetical protein
LRTIVTVDSLPIPPFYGHNRVLFDWLNACAPYFELDLLVYGDSNHGEALKRQWPQDNVRFHFLQRRHAFKAPRALLSNLSIPTVSRDFVAEAALVEKLRKRDSRLLINFISGAPLLNRYNGSGVVLSGHDCMSHFFQQERRYAKKLKDKLVTGLRERFARNAESKYAHLAACVHVVSDLDAAELKRVNPRVKTAVIPLGRSAPPQETIKPWTHRTDNMIWGSLETQPILSGVRAILNQALRVSPHIFADWLLVGRVPSSVANKLLPELDLLRIKYCERLDDLPTALGNTRVLLVPDLAGTGQKTRTLDGLASGCCVAGFPEAFRNIGPLEEANPFLVANSPEDLIEKLRQQFETEAEKRGDRGRQLYQTSFASDALYVKWANLLTSVGPLS